MFMATDSFELLRSRRKEIAAEVHDLKEKMDALGVEDEELAAAERVLLRFGVVTTDVVVTPHHGATGKPPGTPTTPNMILALLREAAGKGKPGLEPREMMMVISRRWWPSVKSEDIGPTAWRMWKAGRLNKVGSVYQIKNTEAAGDLLGREPAASE